MSTKALHDALALLEIYMEEPPSGMSVENAVLLNAARTEVEAIERAAQDLTRLYVGDYVYRVRDMEHVIAAPGNSWDHPDVKAWGDASELLATIAKEAK